MVDTVIKNAKIVSNGEVFSGGIAITDGKITSISNDSNLPKADRTIDARGNYAFPGFMDCHLHMGWPNWPLDTAAEKDTIAAAFGGVTTILNRMNDYGSLVKAVGDLKNTMHNNGYVDFTIQVPIYDDDQIAEIPNLFKMGICGFKFYIPYKGVFAQGLSKGYGIDDGIVYSGMTEIAKLGYPARAQVHCENPEPAFKLRDKLQKQGRQDLAAYAEARPNWLEEEAALRCVYFAKITKCPLHIVHMSTKEIVDVARKARGEGLDVVTEAQPQYLSITKNGPYGIIGKVNPPLRDWDDIEGVWQGIKKGVIELIGSDHAPVPKKDKLELWDAIVGMAAVETYMAVMVTEGVHKGRIAVEKLAEICATNVAKVYGLYPKKGTLMPGSDADITIVDLNKEVTVRAEKLHHINDCTPYEGMKLKGWPLLTMVRGQPIMQDDQLVGRKGFGEFASFRDLQR